MPKISAIAGTRYRSGAQALLNQNPFIGKSELVYSLVLEDRSGIVAFFSRFLGGRDRLASRLLSDGQRGIGLAIRVD